MVNLRARLYIDKDLQVATAMSEINVARTNVSSNISNVIGKPQDGYDMFMLGVSKFSEKSKFVNGDSVGFYVGDVVSNDNGLFEEPYIITLDKSIKLKHIVIIFDLVNNEHPKKIFSQNGFHNVDSPIAIIPVDGTTSPVHIGINDWNKPNRPLRIQAITTFIDIDTQILSVEFGGQDRSDPSLPSWGIKSNSGSLEMFDTYGIIENMRNLGVLVNSPINIYLNVGNRTEQIGGFYVNNANKDRQTLKTKIEYQDILPSWENVEIKAQNPTPIVYSSLRSAIEDIFSNLSIPYINFGSSSTETHLDKINVPNLYYEDGSLWGTMAKICEVAGCYIYCNKQGVPTIHYNEGN